MRAVRLPRRGRGVLGVLPGRPFLRDDVERRAARAAARGRRGPRARDLRQDGQADGPRGLGERGVRRGPPLLGRMERRGDDAAPGRRGSGAAAAGPRRRTGAVVVGVPLLVLRDFRDRPRPLYDGAAHRGPPPRGRAAPPRLRRWSGAGRAPADGRPRRGRRLRAAARDPARRDADDYWRVRRDGAAARRDGARLRLRRARGAAAAAAAGRAVLSSSRRARVRRRAPPRRRVRGAADRGRRDTRAPRLPGGRRHRRRRADPRERVPAAERAFWVLAVYDRLQDGRRRQFNARKIIENSQRRLVESSVF